MDWFNEIIKNLFLEETIISKGIPLQVCDIFLQELNNVDREDLSCDNLSYLLDPFLYAMAHCRNRILVNRIKEKIFMPLLENNVTLSEKSDEEEVV